MDFDEDYRQTIERSIICKWIIELEAHFVFYKFSINKPIFTWQVEFIEQGLDDEGSELFKILKTGEDVVEKRHCLLIKMCSLFQVADQLPVSDDMPTNIEKAIILFDEIIELNVLYKDLDLTFNIYNEMIKQAILSPCRAGRFSMALSVMKRCIHKRKFNSTLLTRLKQLIQEADPSNQYYKFNTLFTSITIISSYLARIVFASNHVTFIIQLAIEASKHMSNQELLKLGVAGSYFLNLQLIAHAWVAEYLADMAWQIYLEEGAVDENWVHHFAVQSPSDCVETKFIIFLYNIEQWRVTLTDGSDNLTNLELAYSALVSIAESHWRLDTENLALLKDEVALQSVLVWCRIDDTHAANIVYDRMTARASSDASLQKLKDIKDEMAILIDQNPYSQLSTLILNTFSAYFESKNECLLKQVASTYIYQLFKIAETKLDDANKKLERSNKKKGIHKISNLEYDETNDIEQ